MTATLLDAPTRAGDAPSGTPGDVSGWEEEPVPDLPTTPWRFFWHFLRRHFLGRLAGMVALVAAGQAIETTEPLVLRRLVNALTEATADGPAPEAVAAVLPWFGLLAVLWFTGPLMYRIYQLVDVHTSPSVRAVVQKKLFAHLLGHSPRYFQDNFAGKLGQKIKQAGQATVGMIDILFFEAARIVVLLAVGGALLYREQPAFAAVLFAWMAVYLVVSVLLARRCVRLSMAMSEQVSTSTGRLIDAIANADLVRGFAKADHERRLLAGFLDEERRCSRRLRRFLVVMRLFQLVASGVLLASLIWMALVDTLAGAMTLGGFTMVFAMGGLVVHSVWNLSHRMLDFFERFGELGEAIRLITGPHEITDPPGAQPLAVRRGAIRVRGLRFAHADGTVVFDGIDLDVAAGEKVALVGPSGAGKSTLVRLLRRQALPQAGTIEIDGQDVTRVTWDSLNEAIAEVPQAPGIFHRPVRDNIRYARPDATDEEVVRAARLAHCHEFIARRPTGYDTIVGEQGIKLSGGERQRIAIARALLKDAPILVLDEATSALDSESEHLIQEALWTLMEGRTVIAIAHRLSTITGMDRIVVLDGGRIVEQGGHAELLARNGLYARLWARQVGGFLRSA